MMQLENSMVAAGITPDEYQHDDTTDYVPCARCSEDIGPDDPKAVENAKGLFCDAACNSRSLYEETTTAAGKAALMRFVAALQLIADEDVLHRAPAIKKHGLDSIRVSQYSHRMQSITDFREHAMALLKKLEIDSTVEWSRIAAEAAFELADTLGKVAR